MTMKLTSSSEHGEITQYNDESDQTTREHRRTERRTERRSTYDDTLHWHWQCARQSQKPSCSTQWSWQGKSSRDFRGEITVKEADLARILLQYHDCGVDKLVRLGDDNVMHIRARSHHKKMLQSVYMHPDMHAFASTCICTRCLEVRAHTVSARHRATSPDPAAAAKVNTVRSTP